MPFLWIDWVKGGFTTDLIKRAVVDSGRVQDKDTKENCSQMSNRGVPRGFMHQIDDGLICRRSS